MARGFESKDVEFQQAEAERTSTTRRALTPAQQQVEAARRGLELALANLRAQRNAATNPIHRDMLDAAIRVLEEQLRSLS